MGALQHGYGSAQVPVTAIDHGLNHLPTRTNHPLLGRNRQHPLGCVFAGHGTKTELCTAAGEWIDDSTDVVANETKASRAAVLLDGATKGSLGISRQAIGFVQDNQLEGRTRISTSDIEKQFENCSWLTGQSHAQ